MKNRLFLISAKRNFENKKVTMQLSKPITFLEAALKIAKYPKHKFGSISMKAVVI